MKWIMVVLLAVPLASSFAQEQKVSKGEARVRGLIERTAALTAEANCLVNLREAVLPALSHDEDSVSTKLMYSYFDTLRIAIAILTPLGSDSSALSDTGYLPKIQRVTGIDKKVSETFAKIKWVWLETWSNHVQSQGIARDLLESLQKQGKGEKNGQR